MGTPNIVDDEIGSTHIPPEMSVLERIVEEHKASFVDEPLDLRLDLVWGRATAAVRGDRSVDVEVVILFGEIIAHLVYNVTVATFFRPFIVLGGGVFGRGVDVGGWGLDDNTTIRVSYGRW